LINTNEETLTIAWCDNGNTDGKFTEGLLYTVIHANQVGIKIAGAIRVNGNQIARQRQTLFDSWADSLKTDWLLWVDSDIVLTIESLGRLLEAGDKDSAKIVSGLYFVSNEPEKSLMRPIPCAYNFINNMEQIEHLTNLPHDQVIEVDAAGMGLILMHKSIIEPIRKVTGDNFVFSEINSRANFVGEDISFFKNVKRAGIKAYLHTGAIADHIKRFTFDINYHNFYWEHKNTPPN
jgi:hypothetical protein